MDVDATMERLYERVELVRGMGDRWRGELCLLSFVALLAGETHSDSPLTASSVIRRFGMVINDEMPMAMRKRLKPFAPRIVGTRDGRDRERANLLVDAWRSEIVPRVVAEFGDLAKATDRRMEALLDCRVAAADAASSEQLAWALAKLIACYARRAGYGCHDWYWLKSIDLLDRLCDLSANSARAPYSTDQARIAMLILDQCSGRRAGVGNGAWTETCSLLPMGVG